MVAMPVLWPIHRRGRPQRVVVATYQAVSGGGLPGCPRARGADREDRRPGRRAHLLRTGGRVPAAFGLSRSPIAHNVLPLAGSLVDDGSGETDEEQKFRDESRKILGLPDLPLVCTCVRVPVFCGHGAAITVELERELSVERASEILARRPGVALDDVPTPLKVAGRTCRSSGRIRRDPTVAHGLSFFVAGDNLRKGAALNAVQIAEVPLGAAESSFPDRVAGVQCSAGGAGGATNAAIRRVRFTAWSPNLRRTWRRGPTRS